MADQIELWLFTTDRALARTALAAGITCFVIDWERLGKTARQRGADTEVNSDAPDDLRRMSVFSQAKRVCRINHHGCWTKGEVETALSAGATDILLPMAETPEEVESFLRSVDGRARAGILVETTSSCENAADIATLGLDHVYVGLNDLAISRAASNIFEPLTDGTVERLREIFSDCAFGFGGLTVVDGGFPIPCLSLMRELMRLDCDYTFLRRSFKRDIVGRDMKAEVSLIFDQWRRQRRRGAREIARDHRRFVDEVDSIIGQNAGIYA